MPGACRPRQMLPPPTTTAVWMPRSTTSRQLPGEQRGGLRVDAVAGVGGSERVTGELQQDPPVHGSRRRAGSRHALDPLHSFGSPPRSACARRAHSPSLYRTKRRTATFSPSLAEASSSSCCTVFESSFTKSCSSRTCVLVQGVQLAVDDLLDHLFGLAGLLRLHLEDVPLAFELVRREFLASEEPGRGRARDVQRDVLHQLAELVGVGDEVGLAVDLDEDAHGVVEVDVAVDEPLIGGAAGALRPPAPAPSP